MQPPSPRAARIPNPRIRRTSCSISRAERTWRHPHSPTTTRTTSSSATEGTYTIDGYTYHIKASADGKFYWFYNNYNAGSEYESFYIGKAGAYIELPAISGKALSKVIPDRCQRRIVFQRSLHHGYGGRRHRRRPVASSRTGHGNL